MALEADTQVGTSPRHTPRELLEAAQGAAVADVAAMTATAVEADATVVADLLALFTTVNALLASLRTSEVIDTA